MGYWQKLELHKSLCENLTIYFLLRIGLHCCSKSCVDFFLLASCTARICLSRLTCCCTVNLLSADTFVSHILQNSTIPSVEKTSSPNSETICLKWDDLPGFTLGMTEWNYRNRESNFPLWRSFTNWKCGSENKSI